MTDTIATITLDATQHNTRRIELTQKQFRFKCKRCAALCCKLGGPPLTKEDVENIEKAGYNIEEFLEPANSNEAPHTIGVMKSNKNGSCVFLEFDTQQNRYKCGIYSVRPMLCRIYPFKLEKLDANRFVLKIIPCCLGLNNPEGEILDEKFVRNHLFEPMVEAVERL